MRRRTVTLDGYAGGGVFKTIGNVAFNFMIPILGGYIGMSIADRPGLYLATTGATFASVAGDVPRAFWARCLPGLPADT